MVHPTALQGFEKSPETYDRGRPTYPDSAVDSLLQELGVQKTDRVLEIAAGTGKFTELLIKRGIEVIAVEPVPAMRRALAEKLPGVHLLEGTAEAIPAADESFDVLFCAQAMHWFDSNRAVQEYHRVLRPGGKVGLIWNARDEREPWVKKLTTIIDHLEKGAPQYRHAKWDVGFKQNPQLFTPLQYHAFYHAQPATADILVDRIASVSYIAAMESSAQRAVLEKVRALVDEFSLGKNFPIPYRTDLFWATRS